MKDIRETILEIERESSYENEIEGAYFGEVNPMPRFDDLDFISQLQAAYKTYCLKGKAFICAGIADFSMFANVPESFMQIREISGIMLKHIEDYLRNPINRTNNAMKYLYESNDVNILAQQIGMLSLHALYMDVTDIYNIPDDIQGISITPEQVYIPIALYTFFTIVANDNIQTSGFNTLFVNGWFNYYANKMARDVMFRMRGNSWKTDLQGVLLDNPRKNRSAKI